VPSRVLALHNLCEQRKHPSTARPANMTPAEPRGTQEHGASRNQTINKGLLIAGGQSAARLLLSIGTGGGRAVPSRLRVMSPAEGVPPPGPYGPTSRGGPTLPSERSARQEHCATDQATLIHPCREKQGGQKVMAPLLGQEGPTTKQLIFVKPRSARKVPRPNTQRVALRDKPNQCSKQPNPHMEEFKRLSPPNKR